MFNSLYYNYSLHHTLESEFFKSADSKHLLHAHICIIFIVNFSVFSDRGGYITVYKVAGEEAYIGSFQNGINSTSYGASSTSVQFVRPSASGSSYINVLFVWGIITLFPK